jgi:hypothetical protein
LTFYKPARRNSSGTIGNIDGASAGIGGADVRVEAGTGDFLVQAAAEAADNAFARGNTNVNINMLNAGRGAGVFLRKEATGTTFSFRRIQGGNGISVVESGDTIQLSTSTATKFTGLLDVPKTYAGSDGLVLVVDEDSGTLVFQRVTKSTTAATAPLEASAGDTWWNTTNGSLFFYYVGENGFGQWVEVGS